MASVRCFVKFNKHFLDLESFKRALVSSNIYFLCRAVLVYCRAIAATGQPLIPYDVAQILLSKIQSHKNYTNGYSMQEVNNFLIQQINPILCRLSQVQVTRLWYVLCRRLRLR